MKNTLVNHVKPFDEKEVNESLLTPSKIHCLIKTQERGLEILEAIKSFDTRRRLEIESINGFPGTFPSLRAKYVNNIDTINRCIDRLYLRYKKVMFDNLKLSI